MSELESADTHTYRARFCQARCGVVPPMWRSPVHLGIFASSSESYLSSIIVLSDKMLFPRIVLSLFFAAAFASAITPPEGELGQGCSQEFVDIGTLDPKHLKIYMADLPRKYTTDLYDQYWDFSYYDRMTWGAPFGKRNPQGDGSLWNSNQYSTGLWFHKQIASSPLRVFDAAEADVVFVPIFTTYLVGYWHRSGLFWGLCER